jgi:tetratricopeptide (TPR) repeat protein
MPGNSGRLIRFWHELKRRNVFRVTTTYAATAYIIIEVTNNLAGPLNLPPWTAKLVILVLAAGLPVAVVLSWTFDFTPHGIKKTESLEELAEKEIIPKPVKRRLKISDIVIAVLLVAVVILAWPKIFKQNTLKRLASSGERIAIAVMPFQNLTNDTLWNVWQVGIQTSLISSLSNIRELKVRQKDNINTLLQTKGVTEHTPITPTLTATISRKLDADIFISGSIKQAASLLRIDAQLVDAKTKDVFKSFDVERPYKEENIIQVIDTLSLKLINYLLISKLIKENYPEMQHFESSTDSPEAYRCFVSGNNAMTKGDWSKARDWYLQALSIDSNFISANGELYFMYLNTGMTEQANQTFLKLYKKKDQLSWAGKLGVNWIYASNFESPGEQIKCLKQLQELDDQNISYPYLMGNKYRELNQYDKAIIEYKKGLEISHKWDIKDYWAYPALGESYHKTGQYKKEKKLYKEAEREFSDHSSIAFGWLVCDQAILSLTERDTIAAARYIEKYISILKENSWSEADITEALAQLYSRANILDKAEEFFRKALLLEPENPDWKNTLAWFLISNDKNTNEGLELIDKALKQRPDDYNYLDTKGWGLYKQGRNNEALEFLEKSWELLKPSYNHEIFLHLEEVKKAVAGQK